MASFGTFQPIYVSLPQEKEKDEADFINTLTHSDFISKCTNYIYNAYIKSSLYYELLHIFITCQLIPTG